MSQAYNRNSNKNMVTKLYAMYSPDVNW